MALLHGRVEAVAHPAAHLAAYPAPHRAALTHDDDVLVQDEEAQVLQTAADRTLAVALSLDELHSAATGLSPERQRHHLAVDELYTPVEGRGRRPATEEELAADYPEEVHPDVDMDMGMSSLHCAVFRQDQAAVDRLLAAGKDPDEPDWAGSGDTPLIQAVTSGHIGIVRWVRSPSETD